MQFNRKINNEIKSSFTELLLSLNVSYSVALAKHECSGLETEHDDD